MALIKVASTLQNCMRYDLHARQTDDKDKTVFKSRNFVRDRDGVMVRVDEIPPIKTVIIKGKNKSAIEMNGFLSPYAMTQMDSKDWEHLKAEYGYTYHIKEELIFAEKNDGMTIDKAMSEEQQAKRTGTDPLKAEDLKVSSGLNGAA